MLPGIGGPDLGCGPIARYRATDRCRRGARSASGHWWLRVVVVVVADWEMGERGDA